MKKSLLIPILILSSLIYTGCFGTQEKTPENVPSAQPQPSEPEPTTPQTETEVVLPTDLEWRILYSDKDDANVMAMYELARKIIEKQRGITGELSLWGSYFGPWAIVILEPKPIDPEFVALDAPTPPKPTFLVDLAAKKLIDLGDWKSARPFIEAQLATYQRGFKDDNARQEFLNHFASSISVIAFGNTDYVEDNGHSNYPPPVSGPRLKTNPDVSELTYYLSSRGMTLFFTECKLTVSHASIIFNSEIVNPE